MSIKIKRPSTMKFEQPSAENHESIYFFSSFDQATLLEEYQAEDTPETEKVYEIPIFREGLFKHYWYGDLEFDLSYLNTLIKNFNARVTSVDIAFDREHMPNEGALAWVQPNGLSIRPTQLSNGQIANVLFAKIKYTPEGVEQILVKKKFKYFSSEISEDYSTREKEPQPDGSYALRSFGPTLIGGGFTNRPFISHLGSVYSKHETDENKVKESGRQVDVIVDYLDGAETIDFAFASYRFSDLQKKSEVENQTKVPDDEPVNTALTKTGEETMKFSEFISKLKSMTDAKERYTFASTCPRFEDAEKEEMRQHILQTEERAYNAHRLAEEQTREAASFKERLTQANEENIALSRRVLEANETSFQNKVKAFKSSMEANGHFPVVIKEVEEILLSLNTEERSFSFSTKEGEEKMDLIGVLGKVFAAVPKEYKVPDPSDLQEVNREGTGPDAVTTGQATPAEEPPMELSDREKKIQAFTAYYGQAPEDDSLLDHIREDGSIDGSAIF